MIGILFTPSSHTPIFHALFLLFTYSGTSQISLTTMKLLLPLLLSLAGATASAKDCVDTASTAALLDAAGVPGDLPADILEITKKSGDTVSYKLFNGWMTEYFGGHIRWMGVHTGDECFTFEDLSLGDELDAFSSACFADETARVTLSVFLGTPPFPIHTKKDFPSCLNIRDSVDDSEVATFVLELPCSKQIVCDEDEETIEPRTKKVASSIAKTASITALERKLEECADTTEPFFRNENELNCKWVGKRRSKRCPKVTDDGFLMSDYCPVSCRTCGENNPIGTAPPSASLYPSASVYPSASPSVAPLCEDFDGTFVRNDNVRDCAWTARKLERCDKTTDSGELISSLCQDTCDVCSPVLAPTVSPSASAYPTSSAYPSTSAYPSGACEDSTGPIFRRDKIWDCARVARRRERRCDKLDNDGVLIADICPETCRTCP